MVLEYMSKPLVSSYEDGLSILLQLAESSSEKAQGGEERASMEKIPTSYSMIELSMRHCGRGRCQKMQESKRLFPFRSKSYVSDQIVVRACILRSWGLASTYAIEERYSAILCLSELYVSLENPVAD